MKSYRLTHINSDKPGQIINNYCITNQNIPSFFPGINFQKRGIAFNVWSLNLDLVCFKSLEVLWKTLVTRFQIKYTTRNKTNTVKIYLKTKL